MPDPTYDVYTYGDGQAVDEDAPTVYRVDQIIDAAEQGGYSYQLSEQLAGDAVLGADDLERLAQNASGEQAGEQLPPTRDEIREKIFARLRRPDGTPYAAGYESGPAARLPDYDEEDTRAGVWRGGQAKQDSDFRTTKYDDRDTLDERASSADGQGRMLDENGDPVNGKWGWVIDEETGYVLLFDEKDSDWYDPDGQPHQKASWETMSDLLNRGYKVRQIHHTTRVAGMPVTGAGIVDVADGFITELTDESGHYRPDAAQEYAAVQALLEQGYSLEQAKIKLTGRQMGFRPTDKAAWIDEAARDNPDFPTGDVTLRADQFVQTEGDEYQIRNKQALNAQINRLGERPGTQIVESPDAEDDDDDGGDGTFIDDSGRRMRMVPDPNNPAYQISVPADDAPGGGPGANPYDGADDTFLDDSGRRMRMVNDPNNPGYRIAVPADEQPASNPLADPGPDAYNNLGGNAYDNPDAGPEGDSSAEQSPSDATADFVNQARQYLDSAGRSEFAQWFATLSSEHQDILANSSQIETGWLSGPQAPPSGAQAWQPAEEHHEAAAQANAASVDELDDRASVPFTVAGFALLIGDGHDQQLVGYADAAADSASGTVTVRKSGLGRGAGSLTFTGVPPAKQDVVRAGVARFSRKEVRFAAATQ